MVSSLIAPKRRRVAVLIMAANRVLLIHRYNHDREYYVVPGGGVEAGETLEQAARREIKEETGLDIELDRQVGDYLNRGQPEHYFLAARFSGTLGLGGPELAEQSAENIFQLEWVSLSQVAALPLKPEFIKKMILEQFGGMIEHTAIKRGNPQ